MAEHESSLAVLVDYENMARPGAKGRGDFDIRLVLDRLSDKGRVIVKRAYADWNRYRDTRHELQNQGLGLIEMPSAREGAKNRADIQMAVDAMEIAYSREHVDIFVIVSGDSDFTPLVGKLRELNKRVLGVGVKDATSELLIANCDEFIFYDSLAKSSRGRSESHDPVELLTETLRALAREGSETPLASLVNDTMKRKYPAFDYSDHGFSTLSKFLEEMARSGVVKLETDPRAGTYRVELADGSVPAATPARDEASEDGGQGTGRRRRRRRRGGGRGGEGNGGSSEADSRDDSADEDETKEVFEHVVSAERSVEEADLPSLDEPISYEDMIMLTPDLDSEPELVEATDSATDAPPTRSSRRRRRRGATADPEPTAADLDELTGEAPDGAAGESPEPSAEEPAEATAESEPAAAEEPAQATAESEPPADGRRRRRRTTQAPEPEPAAPAAAEAEPAEAEGVAQAEPDPGDDAEASVDPVAAAAEATSERRRVRRRSTQTPGDDGAAEEKPKRRRTSRAKKDDAETGEADAAEEKPKRRRTTKAKADEAASGEAEAAEEKPKRRRASRAKKDEAEASGEQAEADKT